MEQVSLAGGPNLPQVVMEKQTIKQAYQKFTVKDSKVEGVSGESISKGIDNVKPGDKSSLHLVVDWLYMSQEVGI
ncbi:hypothetical protein AB1K18_12270 [Peribacillus simplex]|uniref:hypothetical protein n=1 Tax=Peribacillus simplex TaxID=1478 RepID=UPI003B8B4901